jgi:hypothetical protein
VKITKAEGQYDTYRMEVSFGELRELHDRLRDDHAGVVADEMFNALDYYMRKLPAPGEDKKERENAAEKVGDAPTVADRVGGGDREGRLGAPGPDTFSDASDEEISDVALGSIPKP